MKCQRCQKEAAVFLYDADKTDRCGRCSSWVQKIIKCNSCGAMWCEPCWTKPQVQKKRVSGMSDDQFSV